MDIDIATRIINWINEDLFALIKALIHVILLVLGGWFGGLWVRRLINRSAQAT